MDRVLNLIFTCPAGNRSSPERIIYPDFQSTPLVGNYPQCSLNCAEVIVSGGLSLSHLSATCGPYSIGCRDTQMRMGTLRSPLLVTSERRFAQSTALSLKTAASSSPETIASVPSHILCCAALRTFSLMVGEAYKATILLPSLTLTRQWGMPSCEGNCANSFAKSKKARTAAMKRAGSRSSPISSAKSVGISSMVAMSSELHASGA